jgi:signal transduction histidine kinase
MIYYQLVTRYWILAISISCGCECNVEVTKQSRVRCRIGRTRLPGRIVQECLTNIHRHSGSKTAGIRIFRDDGALVLEVRDEGRGMRAERMSEIQSSGSGVGIRGMRERALQLSGTMSIESDASGTRIRVVIPTPKTASQEGRDSHEPLQTAV